MNTEKRTGFASLIASLLLAAAPAFAGRPLTIDDACPVDPGQFEFESGIGYVHESECKHWDFPFGLTYGLISSVEAGIGFGGQFEERIEIAENSTEEHTHHESGIGDLALGVKWQIIEACPLGAQHALAAGITIPTADENKGLGSGETDCDLTWIISRPIGERANVHINAGYSWIGEPENEEVNDILHYGLAVDVQIADPLQWVIEAFAEQEQVSGADTLAMFNTGFRWNPSESLTLDIAGGSKVSGEVPDYIATAGLTWAFGPGSK